MEKNKFAILLSVMIYLAGCSSPERDHRDVPAAKVDSTAGSTAVAQSTTADVDLNGEEKAFLTSAHAKSLFNSALANLASTSSSSQIRKLAENTNADHRKLASDLNKIAKGKGLLLTPQLSSDQQQILESFTKLAQPLADQQYLQYLQQQHSELIKLYADAAKLKNTDIRNFAQNAHQLISTYQRTTTKLIISRSK